MTILNNRKQKNKLPKKSIISNNDNNNTNIQINITNSIPTNTINKVEIKDELSDTYSFNDFLEESDVENDSLDIRIKRNFTNTFSANNKSKNNKKEDANVNEAYIKQVESKEQTSNNVTKKQLFILPNIKVQRSKNSINELSPNQFSIVGAIIRFFETYVRRLKSFNLFILWLALIYINSMLDLKKIRLEWMIMIFYSYYYYLNLFESNKKNFLLLKFFQLGLNFILTELFFDHAVLVYTLSNGVIYVIMAASASGFDIVLVIVILSLLVIHAHIIPEISKDGFFAAIEIIFFAIFLVIHKLFIVLFEYKIEYTSLVNQNRNEVLKKSQCQSFGFIIHNETEDNTNNTSTNNHYSRFNILSSFAHARTINSNEEKAKSLSQHIIKNNENLFGEKGATVFFSSTIFEHISLLSLVKLLYYKYQEQRHFINTSPAISRFRKHLASNSSFLNSTFNAQNRNFNISKSDSKNNKKNSNLTREGRLKKYVTCECQKESDKQDRFYISLSTIMDIHALVDWILPDYINNNLKEMVNNTQQYIIQHSSSFINSPQSLIDNISYSNQIDTSTLLPIPQLIMETSVAHNASEALTKSNSNSSNASNSNNNNNNNNSINTSLKNVQVILQKKDFSIKINNQLWDSYAMFLTNEGTFVSIIYGLEPNTSYRIKVSLNQHWSTPVDIYTKEKLNVNIPRSSDQISVKENGNNSSLIATLEHKKNLYHHLQSNLVELIEERKNNQMALKKLKKETAKALSQLKSEIDYTKRFITKDKQNNMKTVKRIQFIKEYIKQTEQSLEELEQMGHNISNNWEDAEK